MMMPARLESRVPPDKRATRLSSFRAAARRADVAETAGRPSLTPDQRPPLTRLLAGWAASRPDETAFAGGARLTYREALAEVDRVSARLQDLYLPPGSPVAVIMPSGPLAPVLLLGLESAQLLPCLIPAHLEDDEIEAALALVNAQAVVAATKLEDLRPVELACTIAARTFGLRYVLAFGPDLPDGVIDLRAAPGEASTPLSRPAHMRSGIMTLDASSGRLTRCFHVTETLLHAAASVVAAARIRAGETIVSGLAVDDLKGLCTGPVAALLAGAALDTELVGRPETLANMRADHKAHLVLPAWAASLGAQLPGLWHGASTIVLAELGQGLADRRPTPPDAVEVWCQGEAALVVTRGPGRTSPSL